MAAVEFSLILPILVLLWIGGVEVTQALSVDRRLNNLAASLGDLVARSKTVIYSDVDAIFDIAPGAMFPYSTTGLQMRISAVNIDAAQNATIKWSRAKSMTAYADNASVTTISAGDAPRRQHADHHGGGLRDLYAGGRLRHQRNDEPERPPLLRAAAFRYREALRQRRRELQIALHR